MTEPLRIAVFISGGGSNFEAIAQAADRKELGAQVTLVISSRADAYGLERAKKHRIESRIIDPRMFKKSEEFEQAMLQTLSDSRIDVICLAGYLKKLGPRLVGRYKGRILNIHPALLPKYGGPGMYGHHVHEAVVKAGDKESGCSVHMVDEEYDRGPVIAQARVAVLPNDTPEELAGRVLEQEHQLYPKAIRTFCEQLLSKKGKTL